MLVPIPAAVLEALDDHQRETYERYTLPTPVPGVIYERWVIDQVFGDVLGTPWFDVLSAAMSVEDLGERFALLRTRHQEQESAGQLVSSYGVADSIEQLLGKYPFLADDDHQYLVSVAPVTRAEQSPQGGWRWHKHGPYVGEQEPQHEYLYDTHIDEVLAFSVYEYKQRVPVGDPEEGLSDE